MAKHPDLDVDSDGQVILRPVTQFTTHTAADMYVLLKLRCIHQEKGEISDIALPMATLTVPQALELAESLKRAADKVVQSPKSHQ